MRILQFPDKRLFQKSKIIEEVTPDVRSLLDQMWDTMKEARGMGLSANQVGLEHDMFVMEGPNGVRYNMINPAITFSSIVPAMLKEGCLSAPNEFIIVGDRSDCVQVTFNDINNEPQVAVFKDIYAVCVQHEIEHLQGKAFIQSRYLPKKIRKELAKKWGLK